MGHGTAPSASTSDGKVGIAAAVGLTIVTGQAGASILAGVTVASGGLVTVKTSNQTGATTTADGSASLGATANVGVAVALNVPTVLNQATIGGTVNSNGIDVEAVQPAAASDNFVATATSGASDASKVGVAGSFALDLITTTTQALLQSRPWSTPEPGQSPWRQPRTTSSQTKANANVSGDPSKAGVGASVAIDKENNTVPAAIQDTAQLSGGTNLTITATANHSATTEGDSGAAGGTAVDASVALNFIDNETTAKVGSGQGIAPSGTVTISTTTGGQATATANGTAMGTGVAIGAAVAITVATDNAQATTLRNITAGGAVSITATTQRQIGRQGHR